MTSPEDLHVPRLTSNFVNKSMDLPELRHSLASLACGAFRSPCHIALSHIESSHCVALYSSSASFRRSLRSSFGSRYRPARASVDHPYCVTSYRSPLDLPPRPSIMLSNIRMPPQTSCPWHRQMTELMRRAADLM